MDFSFLKKPFFIKDSSYKGWKRYVLTLSNSLSVAIFQDNKCLYENCNFWRLVALKEDSFDWNNNMVNSKEPLTEEILKDTLLRVQNMQYQG